MRFGEIKKKKIYWHYQQSKASIFSPEEEKINQVEHKNTTS